MTDTNIRGMLKRQGSIAVRGGAVHSNPAELLSYFAIYAQLKSESGSWVGKGKSHSSSSLQ
jgi:hypothetical protein